MRVSKITGGSKGLINAVRTGQPTLKGMYVVYINPPVDVRYSKRRLMAYANGIWRDSGCTDKYNGEVHAWIGPLPFVELSE